MQSFRISQNIVAAGTLQGALAIGAICTCQQELPNWIDQGREPMHKPTYMQLD